MTIPKINSAHGPDTRNIINRAIDSINTQGKSIQDLVAEGQLTPTQYANLITSVNGMIKSGEVDKSDLTPELRSEVDKVRNKIDKGDVSVYDINKNKGKLDSTFFSDTFLQELNGGTINATNVLDGSITNDKLAPKSIKEKNIAFMHKNPENRNLFDGTYKTWVLIGGDGTYFLQEDYSPYIGGLAVVPVEPGKTYTIKIHDPELSNVFRIGWSQDSVVFTEGQFSLSGAATAIQGDTYTWSNTDSNYLYIYNSNDGSNPRMQVEEGSIATEYQSYYVFDASVLPDKESEKASGIVVEHPNTGYPERSDSPSVVYFGVNPPHDAEPFDEWRELNGFPYVLDFEEVKLTDFTKVGVDTGNVSISPDSYDGTSALKYVSTEYAYQGLVWDNVSDNYMVDQEIFIEVRATADTYRPASTLHRFNEDVNGELSYYAIGYYNGSLDIMKKEVGTGNKTLKSASKTVDSTHPFRIRSRVTEDGFISAKLWQSTDSEPLEWDVEVSDISILPSTNKLGIYAYGETSNIRALGVSTGGMTAPKRKWW